MTQDHHVRVELVPEPRCVPEARRLVRTALHAWSLKGIEPTASLLVTEVATNALLHARTVFVVEAVLHTDRVRIGVTDRSLAPPAPRRLGLGAGTGRGLALVALLATTWGTEAADAPWSKTVWFELPRDAAALREPAEGELMA